MKISIIGAGNVGGLTAMRLAQEQMGEITLIDIAGGIAQGKSFDMEDAKGIFKLNYNVTGTDDFKALEGSDIVVITAGFTRKPGMTREDLLLKNAQVLKDICLKVKDHASRAIVIIVTNPLDLMTRYALKITGFSPNRLFGMGVSLDSSRFANLISKELKVPCSEIDACVIGSHGEGMLPLTRFTTIRGVSLEELMNEQKLGEIIQKTIQRGKEIVSLLGSGSAYFAPSAAIYALVKAIIKDEKRILGLSAQLNGEFGIRDVCIGVPCRLGKEGIENIIELDLDPDEKKSFLESVNSLKEQFKALE